MEAYLDPSKKGEKKAFLLDSGLYPRSLQQVLTIMEKEKAYTQVNRKQRDDPRYHFL